MQPFVVQLEDRALSLARAGRVLQSTPSAVFDGGTSSAAGTQAWGAVRSQPTATSTRHLGIVLTDRTGSNRATDSRARQLLAAELRQRLQEHPPLPAEPVWIASPACADASGLGSVLEIAQSIGLAVTGFVDCAVATVASLEAAGDAVVLEVGLHHVAATAIDVDRGQARRRRSVLSPAGGLVDLYQAWLQLISTTMMKRTRFDPLHYALIEQRLFDVLPSLAETAARHDSVTVEAAQGSERFTVDLTRDQFAAAARPWCRTVVGLLHQLRTAGAPLRLMAPRIVAGFPGLGQELERFVGCELIRLPDGYAAAAASLLGLPQSADGVRLIRRLPVQPRSELVGEVSREPVVAARDRASPPSHVLFDGRAFSLGGEPLVVGRAPGAPPAIVLPDGLAGVSRRHCTFISDGDERVLLDHSSFGTFVNGERVAERARVHAGDLVRLGEPGVELALIAVGEAGG
ncbi:MAG TPA: FHA domain-containing protein [Steroidobacteraceae bacterium]|nr:FHA domain-containing protein [Steroidobacteraceae bacterium]